MQQAVQSRQRTRTERLGEFLAALRYEDLPATTVEVVKKDILDTLATIIAGSSRPACRILVETLQSMPTPPEATIYSYGIRCSARDAALANGTMAHAWDFDDTYDITTPLHAGASVVSSSLAVAEKVGNVSGMELVAAVAAGLELMCRLSRATVMGLRGWHLTSVYGYFGAAAACAKILNLPPDKLLNAMGIAYAQAAGNTQMIPEGADTKPFQPGFASQAGAFSALLAERGLTGPHEVFDGDSGLFNVYHRGEYDSDAIYEALGRRYFVDELSFKPWPSCRYTHAFLTAAIALRKEHNLKPEDIEEIRVAPPTLSEPIELKRHPRNLVDGQFSVPYVVAVAMVKGNMTVADYADEALRDPRTLAMAERIVPEPWPEAETDMGIRITPGRVTVRTRGGATLQEVAPVALGHPENPVSFEDIATKFRACTASSVARFDAGSTERVIEALRSIDSIGDVRAIAKDLAGRSH